MLELPHDLGINPTFNVSVLVEYIEPVSIPSELFGPRSIMSEPTLECPPTIFLERREKVEYILDDQIISTRKKGYRCYQVHWEGRPDSKNSWITQEDLQRISLDLLEYYLSQTNPSLIESCFSNPRRIGEGTRVYLNSLWFT